MAAMNHTKRIMPTPIVGNASAASSSSSSSSSSPSKNQNHATASSTGGSGDCDIDIDIDKKLRKKSKKHSRRRRRSDEREKQHQQHRSSISSTDAVQIEGEALACLLHDRTTDGKLIIIGAAAAAAASPPDNDDNVDDVDVVVDSVGRRPLAPAVQPATDEAAVAGADVITMPPPADGAVAHYSNDDHDDHDEQDSPRSESPPRSSKSSSSSMGGAPAAASTRPPSEGEEEEGDIRFGGGSGDGDFDLSNLLFYDYDRQESTTTTTTASTQASAAASAASSTGATSKSPSSFSASEKSPSSSSSLELEYGADGIVRSSRGGGGGAASGGAADAASTNDDGDGGLDDLDHLNDGDRGFRNNNFGRSDHVDDDDDDDGIDIDIFDSHCGELYTIVEEQLDEYSERNHDGSSSNDHDDDDDGSCCCSAPRSITEDEACTDNERSAFSLLDFENNNGEEPSSASASAPSSTDLGGDDDFDSEVSLDLGNNGKKAASSSLAPSLTDPGCGASDDLLEIGEYQRSAYSLADLNDDGGETAAESRGDDDDDNNDRSALSFYSEEDGIYETNALSRSATSAASGRGSRKSWNRWEPWEGREMKIQNSEDEQRQQQQQQQQQEEAPIIITVEALATSSALAIEEGSLSSSRSRTIKRLRKNTVVQNQEQQLEPRNRNIQHQEQQMEQEQEQLQPSSDSIGKDFVKEEDAPVRSGRKNSESRIFVDEEDSTPIRRSGRRKAEYLVVPTDDQQHEHQQQPPYGCIVHAPRTASQHPISAGDKKATAASTATATANATANAEPTKGKLEKLPTWGQILKNRKENNPSDGTSNSSSNNSSDSKEDDSRKRRAARRSSTGRNNARNKKWEPPPVIEFETPHDIFGNNEDDCDYDTLNVLIDEHEVEQAIARIAAAKNPNKDHNDASINLYLDPISTSIRAAAAVPIVDAGGVITAEAFGKSKDHNDASANLRHSLITSSIKLAAEVDIVGNGEGEDAIANDDPISASVREAAGVVANEFNSGIVDVEPSDAALVENQQSKPQEDNDSPSSFKKDNQFKNSFPRIQPSSSSETSSHDPLESMLKMASMRTLRESQLKPFPHDMFSCSNSGGSISSASNHRRNIDDDDDNDNDDERSSISSYDGSNPSNVTEEKGMRSSGELCDLLSLDSAGGPQLYTQMVADVSSTIARMEEKSRSTCDELLDLLSLVSNDASVGTSDHGDDHLEVYVSSPSRDEREDGLGNEAEKVQFLNISDDPLRRYAKRSSPSESELGATGDRVDNPSIRESSSEEDEYGPRYIPESSLLGRFSDHGSDRGSKGGKTSSTEDDDELLLRMSAGSTGRFSRSSVASSKASSSHSSKLGGGKQPNNVAGEVNFDSLNASEHSLGRFSTASLSHSKGSLKRSSDDLHDLDVSDGSVGRFSVASLTQSKGSATQIIGGEKGNPQNLIDDQNSTGGSCSVGKFSRASRSKNDDQNSLGEISSSDEQTNELQYMTEENFANSRFSKAFLSQSMGSILDSSVAEKSSRSRFSLDASRGSKGYSSGGSTAAGRRNHRSCERLVIEETTVDRDDDDDDGSCSTSSESSEGSSSVFSSDSSHSSSTSASKSSTGSDSSDSDSDSDSTTSSTTHSSSGSESYPASLNEDESSKSSEKESRGVRTSISLSFLSAIEEAEHESSMWLLSTEESVDAAADIIDAVGEEEQFKEEEKCDEDGVSDNDAPKAIQGTNKIPSKRLFGRNMILSRRLSDLDVSMDKLHPPHWGRGGARDSVDSDGDESAAASDASSTKDGPKEEVEDEAPTAKRVAFNPKKILKRHGSRKHYGKDASADEKEEGNNKDLGLCNKEGEDQTSKRGFGRKKLLKRQSSRKKNSLLDVTTETVGGDDKEANPAGESDEEESEVKEEEQPTQQQAKVASFRPKRMLKGQSSREKNASSSVNSEKDVAGMDNARDSSDNENENDVAEATKLKLTKKPKKRLRRKSVLRKNSSHQVVTSESESPNNKSKDGGESSDSEDEAQSKCPLQPNIKLKGHGSRKMVSGDGGDIRVFHPKKMLRRHNSRIRKVLRSDKAAGNNDHANTDGNDNREDHNGASDRNLKRGQSSRKEGDIEKGDGSGEDENGESEDGDSSPGRESDVKRHNGNQIPDASTAPSSGPEKSSENGPSSFGPEEMEKSKGKDNVSSSRLSIATVQRQNNDTARQKALKSVAGTNDEDYSPTNPTKEDKIASEITKQVLFNSFTEEITPAQRNEEKVPEDHDCEDVDEDVCREVAEKHGFKPRSLLRKQGSRMKKVLDVTAEKVASVTADIATLPKSSHSIPRSGSRRHVRQLSRKDFLARERAIKRREQQFRGGGRRRSTLSQYSYHDRDAYFPTPSSNVSLSTEASADFTHDEQSEPFDMYESEGESRRVRRGHRDRTLQGPKAYNQRRSRSHPIECDNEPHQHHRGNKYDHRENSQYQNGGHGSVCSRYSRGADFHRPSSRGQYYEGDHHPRHYHVESNRNVNACQDKHQEPVSWDDLQGAIEAGRKTSIDDLSRNPPPVSQYTRDPSRNLSAPQSAYDPPREHDNHTSYTAGNHGGDGGAGGQDVFSWDDLEDAINVGVQSSLSDLNFKVVKKQEYQLNAGGNEANQDCDGDGDSNKPWQCQACTFVNENGAFLLCGVCNQPRT